MLIFLKNQIKATPNPTANTSAGPMLYKALLTTFANLWNLVWRPSTVPPVVSKLSFTVSLNLPVASEIFPNISSIPSKCSLIFEPKSLNTSDTFLREISSRFRIVLMNSLMI